MIQLTRLNQQQLVLNSDLIEHIESTPDTVITLTTGAKFMVRESADEIIRLVAEFRRQSAEDWRSCAVLRRAAVDLQKNKDSRGED
ncbi:MAG: flagellar FlbD family protein [Acidobacteriota bacterium]